MNAFNPCALSKNRGIRNVMADQDPGMFIGEDRAKINLPQYNPQP
jgi:hypothetical protein